MVGERVSTRCVLLCDGWLGNGFLHAVSCCVTGGWGTGFYTLSCCVTGGWATGGRLISAFCVLLCDGWLGNGRQTYFCILCLARALADGQGLRGQKTQGHWPLSGGEGAGGGAD